MNLADGARALAAIPEAVLEQLAPIPYAVLKALVAWLDHEDDNATAPAELEQLPTVLKSELALARAEARAKVAPQG